MPAASRAVRAVMISTASVGRRYPLTASLMSCSVRLLTWLMSPASRSAASRSFECGSRASSLLTSSDLSVIMDSDCPVRSCMSRASRSRSSLAASFATVSRARLSSCTSVA
jgi:hypothetical protein